MQIIKDIAKSFNKSNSSIEKVSLMRKSGVKNGRDLSRISGIPISQFIRLGIEDGASKEKINDLAGAKLGSEEIHFYEIVGALLSLDLLKKLIIVSELDFAETLLMGSSISYDKENDVLKSKNITVDIRSSLPGDINLDIDTLLLKPNIGGYLAKNTLLIKAIEDLSINQLDILYKGITERNPNHSLLSEIILTIQKKLQ